MAALLVAASDALGARFGALSVRGEISGFSRPASGHCYFALKDSDGAPALLRCAMFRRAAMLLPFSPADGQQVELRGRLALYEARGELQMVVESMQRLGEGALYEEFLRRKARLAAAGLFDLGRKRPLPPYPRRIGIVTSLGAAALRDVMVSFSRRAPQVALRVYPSPVQGSEAPAALVAALDAAARDRFAEVVLLVRGGGSLEDLWAFNDERLVRAIVACPVPLVCGVGHESDVTLADLAADLRAPTPTAAAEVAAAPQAELLEGLQARADLLARGVERQLSAQAQRLDRLSLRLGQPARQLELQHRRLMELATRLSRALGQRRLREAETLPRQAARLAHATRAALAAQALRLEASTQRLQAQDPARVLQRGYAWVERADGTPLVSSRGLAAGQSIRAVWADGRALAKVERVDPSPEALPASR